jgi:diguanylate cyclase (GGDEF)-like protein/PAS domain S-box-containing protein
MPIEALPYTLAILCAALISLVVTFYALRINTSSHAKKAFLVFMVGITIWCLSYAFEVASLSLQIKLFWANLQYVGVMLMPPAYLAFILYYTHNERYLTKVTWAILALLSISVVTLVWTDASHNFLRINTHLIYVPFPELEFIKGPLYWSGLGYFYAILLIGSVLLIRNMYRSNSLYRGQGIALLTATLLPWGASITEILNLDPIPHLSVTVFSFTFSGLIYLLALTRYRLLEILPIAQNAIFTNMQDGILILDSRQHINNLNPTAEKLLGVETRHVLGKHVNHVLPLAEGGHTIRTPDDHCVMEWKNGDAYYDIRCSGLFDSRDLLIGYLILMQEVTARKLAEEALHISESRLRAIFHNRLVGLGLMDGSGRFMQANECWCNMLGYSLNELLRMNYVEVTHPDDRQMSEERLQQLIQGEQGVYQIEKRFLTRTGQEIWGQVYSSAIRGQNGNLEAISYIVIDITERKKWEAALRQSENKYRNVVERARDGILILQSENIKYANPQFAQMLGYSVGELLQLPVLEIIPHARRPAVREYYFRRMNGEDVPTNYETEMLHRDGSIISVEVNAGLMEYETQTADLVFVRDIRHRIQVQTELTAKNAELERAIQQENRLRALAEKRSMEAETLRQAGLVVSAALKQEETIDRILEQLALVVPYDSAAVQLKRDSHLEIVGSRGFADPKQVLGMKFPLDEHNPGAHVIQTRQSLILGDLRDKYPEYYAEFDHKTRSWLGIPLTIKDNAIGIFSLDSHEMHHFTQEHAQLAATFAIQVAIALENARLFEEVHRLAITDPLTGIFNRRHFYNLTMREFERSRRYNTHFSLLMMDIDNFKLVNDTLGHPAGDQVLQQVAHLFQVNLRKADIPCRYGGEEFTATLPETGIEAAHKLARRLCAKIAGTTIHTDRGDVHITVSIGVAEHGDACDTLDKLLDCTDRALYAAKTAGRKQVALYAKRVK